MNRQQQNHHLRADSSRGHRACSDGSRGGLLEINYTCFTSFLFLVDVILTCNTDCVGKKTFHFNCGLSDVHNIFAKQLKLDVPSKKPRWCVLIEVQIF